MSSKRSLTWSRSREISLNAGSMRIKNPLGASHSLINVAILRQRFSMRRSSPTKEFVQHISHDDEIKRARILQLQRRDTSPRWVSRLQRVRSPWSSIPAVNFSSEGPRNGSVAMVLPESFDSKATEQISRVLQT